MNNILVVDRQPLLRLGLKLLLEKAYKQFCLFEESNIDAHLNKDNAPIPSLIILGLNMECDQFDKKNIRYIKEKFPNSKIIIYGDNDNRWKISSYFNLGVLAYVSKQADEAAVVSCIRAVLDNKSSISFSNNKYLINDNTLPPRMEISKKLTAREHEVATYLCNDISSISIAETINRKPSTIKNIKRYIFKKLAVENIFELKEAMALYLHMFQKYTNETPNRKS